MRNSVAALMIIGAFVATGCNPILRTHGYVPTQDAKPQEINPSTDTKASVLASLGSPSIEGTFDEEVDEDTWYYINQVRERYAYLRPQIQDQTVTAISFNVDGQVTKVAEYGIEDRRVVNYENRETPTRGRELSVLEQVFGTIGRIPTDRIGGNQDDVPGGAGGPR
jgi:outer membrane protein assembly factor BamE (lipoprotein component of BamABCDE complex)